MAKFGDGGVLWVMEDVRGMLNDLDGHGWGWVALGGLCMMDRCKEGGWAC